MPPKTKSFTTPSALLAAFAAAAVSSCAFAVEVTQEQAQTAARNWVRRSYVQMTAEFASDEVMSARTSRADDGKALYHVMEMDGGGYVVTSGDTELPPVIAFSASGTLDLSDSGNPLVAMLESDMAARRPQASKAKTVLLGASAAPEEDGAAGAFEDEWASLLEDPEAALGKGGKVLLGSQSSLSDVRVAPLVQSKWTQAAWNGYNTFNYHTPNNYVCGCVATAFSQVMRYWRMPSGSVSAGTYNCWVDFTKVSKTMMGGTYSWDSMPLTSSGCYSDDQRRAIGKLTYDVGVAAQMGWTKTGSGTLGCVAAQALRHRFGYASAHSYGGGYSGSLTSGLASNADFRNAILASLDAGMPVVVGITGNGGHEVVVDGYGYNGSSGVIYCHVNCGWSGSEDAWYNLMGERVTSYGFSSMAEVAYNIHPSVSGDVISGRVLSASGSPVSGATVTLTPVSGPQQTATTNAKGIYWFRAPANASYSLVASSGGMYSASQTVDLPESCDTEYLITGMNSDGTVYYTRSSSSGRYLDGKLGNKWGVELTLRNSSSPPPGVSLATALDNTSLAFTTGGSASWYGQTAKSHDGSDAARSGAIVDSQQSWLQTTVTGPGVLSFYWSVSCEGSASNQNWDYLSVSVDGEEKARICGTDGGWSQLSYSVPSGSHTVRWLYSKDGSTSKGDDAGYVDEVVWTPTASPGDDYDPDDDTPGGGTAITPYETAATHDGHTLGATDKYDFFKVYLSAGYKYVFWTTGSMDTYGDVFDSTDLAGVVACDDDGGDNRNFKVTYAPSQSGTYYLRVRAYTLGASGAYSLSYQRLAADAGVAAEKPDLLPYTPSGWSSPLVVSDSNLSKEGSTSFSVSDSLYVSWAVVCRNANAAETFYSRLYVDGTLVKSWYSDGLQKNYYAWVGGYLIGKLGVGVHTVRVVHDADGAVEESNEGNNAFEATVTVTAFGTPNLTVVNQNVSKTTVMQSEPVVVHWRVENDGNGQSALCKTRIQVYKYTDGGTKLVNTVWADCAPLAAGAGRNYMKSISLKAFGTGTYSIVVSADGKYSVAEIDETDNSETTSVYVTRNITTKKSSLVDWRFHKLNSKEPAALYLSTSTKSRKKVSTFRRGQPIYVQLNFWNAMLVRTLDGVYVRAQINGGRSQTWYWPPMGSGVTGYISSAYRAPSMLQNLPPGTYTLTVTLDCYDNWWETSEVNNIKRLSFRVVEAPALIGEDSFECALREPVSWALSSEGAVTVKGLPPGLKYKGGAITGRATKTGTYRVRFTAKNAAGAVARYITIVVKNPGFAVDVNVRANGATESASVPSGATVPMFAGVVQKLTVASTPGKPGISKSAASSVSVTGLPPGLKYAKGVISGVPTKTGTYSVRIVFRNALGWSKSFTMKMAVSQLPAFARKAFNGWSYAEAGRSRKVSVSVTAAGKISAKVGSLSFSRNGWAVSDSGAYVANMRNVRTTGSGKGKKTYTDVLALALDPNAAWTEDQLTGHLVTFSGNVSLSSALAAIDALKDGGVQAVLDAGTLPVPLNSDTGISTRRNPYGDADNLEAKALAAELAALGTQVVEDGTGTSWKAKVAANGVATISRTTGTGRSRKVVTATAVVTWDGEGHQPAAVFLAGGRIIAVDW